MKVNAKSSLIGGVIAIILATACCWLPVLLVSIGAGTGLLAFADGVQGYSTYLMFGGVAFILVGGIQLYNRRTNSVSKKIISTSTIICPLCGHSKKELMPIDACQYFFECENCHEVIKPKEGDCCVYCSYGDVPCPPIQQGEDCCSP